jgi:hypothetical protein
MNESNEPPRAAPPDGQATAPNSASDARAEELARRAAAFLKAAKPAVSRMVEEARPRVEEAGRQAVGYVRDHEDEIKSTAVRLARARFVGPLGMVVDAVVAGASMPRPAPEVACPACTATNPAGARYCNQCGDRIATPE